MCRTSYSRDFEVRSGIRMGCIISPRIFLLVVSDVLKVLCHAKLRSLRLLLAKPVTRFTYLCSELAKYGGTNKDIEVRLSKALKSFGIMASVWRWIAKKTFYWNLVSSNKRPAGRPRITWKSTVETEFAKAHLGYTFKQLGSITQNRVRWRTAMSLKGTNHISK